MTLVASVPAGPVLVDAGREVEGAHGAKSGNWGQRPSSEPDRMRSSPHHRMPCPVPPEAGARAASSVPAPPSVGGHARKAPQAGGAETWRRLLSSPSWDTRLQSWGSGSGCCPPSGSLEVGVTRWAGPSRRCSRGCKSWSALCLGVQQVGWELGGVWGAGQRHGRLSAYRQEAQWPPPRAPPPSGPPAPVSPRKEAEVPSPRLTRRTGQRCPRWVGSSLPLAPCAWDSLIRQAGPPLRPLESPPRLISGSAAGGPPTSQSAV
uniref:Uncharacterized protein n=1 Tax=Myotis myotis TaxID=51298 RepID=A0A7J7XI22_MYOMY|nr:hypothetical protein mMyoMyo1_011586 [Myotis myotis]